MVTIFLVIKLLLLSCKVDRDESCTVLFHALLMWPNKISRGVCVCPGRDEGGGGLGGLVGGLGGVERIIKIS